MTPRTVSVLLDDQLLSLNRAVGILRRRNVPIDSISVGPAQAAGLARLTVTLSADGATVDRMVKQLRKMVGVRQAVTFAGDQGVTRELALIKVRPPHHRFAEVLDTVQLFGASVADEGPTEIIVEVAGSGPMILSLLRALEPFGIVEAARSGSIALERAEPARAELAGATRGQPFEDHLP